MPSLCIDVDNDGRQLAAPACRSVLRVGVLIALDLTESGRMRQKSRRTVLNQNSVNIVNRTQ